MHFQRQKNDASPCAAMSQEVCTCVCVCVWSAKQAFVKTTCFPCAYFLPQCHRLKITIFFMRKNKTAKIIGLLAFVTS